AYWKVWWDGAAQESAAVSLQQNYDAADAEASFADLQQTFDRPALVGKGDYGFTTEAGFSVPGVPGASAGVLDGSFDFAGASTAVQFRYLLVARGSVVALVGMTAFGRPTNRSTFDSFAAHEYSALDGPASHLLLLWLAVAAGAVLVVVGLFERSRRRPAAPATSVRPVPPAAGPMPYEPSGYGAAPPGYGAPPGYVVPPPSYGVSSPGFGPAGAGGYSPSGPPPYKPPPGRGTASPASGSAPAAGWYRDPSPEAPAGQFRYWDGTTWTYSTKDSLDDG
ncbi:MAG TPA: DUF2510 domain-containing protein, partial [Acidimicrobiales bacterium]|nr:DUF2510 domain-containing protein [Acidimicrobiales bacterium]